MHAVRLQDNARQFDTFRATLRSTFLEVEHEPRPSIGTVRAEFHPRRTGGLVATWVKSLGQGYSSAYRDRHHILTDPSDCLVLMLVRAGNIWHQQLGRSAQTAQGEMVLIDSRESYQVRYTNSSACLTLRVPRKLLQEALSMPERYCGIAINGRHGLNALHSDFLFSTWRHTESFSICDEGTIRARVIETLASLCGSVVNQAMAQSSANALHFERARRFIASRLKVPGLAPADIACALRISISRLHAVMHSNGTSAGKMILGLRLDRCRDALADPSLSKRTITRIALDWGFADSAHFTKTFKARFGLTPRQYRCRAL